MTIFRSTIAPMALACGLAQAEVPSVHASPVPLNIAATLNLDAARAGVVQAILENARQAMDAIREDTDKQLAAVLTADELVKLREGLPPPHRQGDGARRRGTAM